VRAIDLNCDCGEGDDAKDAALLAVVTSANIACGGHAGDLDSMRRTAAAALAHGVAIGAHPAYADRHGFGRLAVALSPAAVADLVASQVRSVGHVVRSLGGELRHIKPHGALYHAAADDPEVAAAVAEGAASWSHELVLVGLPGSPGLECWRQLGWQVAAEGFVDRCYEAGGALRDRRLPGALIVEPEEAARQALRMATDGAVATPGQPARQVDTLCLHGDGANAIAIAQAVRNRLLTAGWLLRPSAYQRSA
jgi:UPF0271 protein